jgi:hypothetical protein
VVGAQGVEANVGKIGEMAYGFGHLCVLAVNFEGDVGDVVFGFGDEGGAAIAPLRRPADMRAGAGRFFLLVRGF